MMCACVFFFKTDPIKELLALCSLSLSKYVCTYLTSSGVCFVFPPYRLLISLLPVIPVFDNIFLSFLNL